MMPAPPGETYHGTGEARAEARIEAHALFARRPALSRCGGLSPVSGARGVGWTGRHPTSPPTAPLMLSSHPASPSLRLRHCAPAPCASERRKLLLAWRLLLAAEKAISLHTYSYRDR